jgi:hypothetical protein
VVDKAVHDPRFHSPAASGHNRNPGLLRFCNRLPSVTATGGGESGDDGLAVAVGTAAFFHVMQSRGTNRQFRDRAHNVVAARESEP